MKTTSGAVTIVRYLVVLAVLITTWVAFYYVLRWATADCWILKRDIQGAVEKKC